MDSTVRRATLALAPFALVATILSGCDGATTPPANAARALEARLLAPCCWVQTLDVHESEVATALRTEIAERLSSGEAAVRVEEDLVARFGERIRAVPRSGDPWAILPAVLAVLMLGSFVVLALVVRAWRRRTAEAAPPDLGPRPDCPRDRYDERLDDELADLREA